MEQSDNDIQSTPTPGRTSPPELTKRPELSLTDRVKRLEQERAERTTLGVYSRFYAPLAVLTATAHALPIYGDVLVSDNTRRTFGTVWDMAGHGGGGSAALGIMLMATLATCLAIAAVRVHTPALPGAIAMMGLLVAVMVLGKPETGDPSPPLASGGILAVTLGLAIAGVSGAHALHLARHQRLDRSR